MVQVSASMALLSLMDIYLVICLSFCLFCYKNLKDGIVERKANIGMLVMVWVIVFKNVK